MLDIKICELDVMPYHKDNYEYILSIVDPGIPFVKRGPLHEKHTILEISDIDHVLDGHKTPDINFIKEILDFSNQLPNSSKIIVHCHMGISRSPAVAIILLIEKGLSAKEAFKYVEKIRPVLYPNSLILELYGNYTNNFDVINEYYEWKARDIEKGHIII